MARFVVQQHDATTLHFDFRIESGGVLRSWAVPKGPSTDPADKRLAVHVDDHAMAHATYESANVEIWDSGWYEYAGAGSVADAIEAGHLRFVLHGDRLHGGFALTRAALGGDERNWLLVKTNDPPG
jgi:DNA ligase D-like protein (predicted 3'-phosphoesterase)